jgi:hypothetical protein
VLTPGAQAQAIGSLVGTVTDSLRKAPLAGATIRVRGSSVIAQSDGSGRFRLDSLPFGTLRVAIEHPSLDSIGLFQVERSIVHDGRRRVQLATPSLADVWRGACPTQTALDSGIVLGAVRFADDSVAPGANVELSWTRPYRTTTGTLGQRRIKYETTADARGRFIACGIAVDEAIAVAIAGGRASVADSSRISLTLSARSDPVRTVELMLGMISTEAERVIGVGSESTHRADRVRTVLRGVVSSQRGQGVRGARVLLDDDSIAMTDSVGRYRATVERLGTRTISIVAVGHSPFEQQVNIRHGDTITVSPGLARVNTLSTVRTEASIRSELVRAFEDRQRSGIGRFRDSVELARKGTMSDAFSGFPNVRIISSGGAVGKIMLPKPPSLGNRGTECEARYYVDGVSDDLFRINRLQPKDIAWIEVYTRPTQLPAEFQVTTKGQSCGVVAIMTKWKIAK